MASQVREMCLSLALGLACGLYYDLLRAVRCRLPGRVPGLICDFAFCALSVTALMLLGLTAGQGRQRIFMAVFALLAGGIYACTLSPGALKMWTFLVDIISFPLKLLLKGLKFVYDFLKKLFHFLIDGVIIAWNKFIVRHSPHGEDAAGADGSG